MTAELVEQQEAIEDHLAKGLVEAARWHTLRYDSLRASLASRASFVVSVDAILIAGVTFLFSWAAGQGVPGGPAALLPVGLGTLVTLVLATLSVRSASRALLSSQSWRNLFGGEPPLSMFYQHSDTIKAAPSYVQFRASLVEQTPALEAESAMVNLWLVLRTHAHRYQHLRVATKQLQYATLAFAASSIGVLVLGLIDTLLGKR